MRCGLADTVDLLQQLSDDLLNQGIVAADRAVSGQYVQLV